MNVCRTSSKTNEIVAFHNFCVTNAGFGLSSLFTLLDKAHDVEPTSSLNQRLPTDVGSHDATPPD